MVKDLYFRNDGKSVVGVNTLQKRAVQALNESIQNGTLMLVKNHCLCGNSHADQDIVISEKDMYGIFWPIVICSKCGLIRSDLVFDDDSNDLFYRQYYRDIYTTKQKVSPYFETQVARGRGFVELLSQNKLLSEINTVAEIGCGAGGILLPFSERGMHVSGYDLDEYFLEYGISQNLNLIKGDFYKEVPDNSLDLVIASHVMEHFLSPIEELQKIISKVKAGKYLLVEVPGLFYQSDGPLNPIMLFQNAHVFQDFSKDHLMVMFEKLGLEIVYGNERCTFICRKKQETLVNPGLIYDDRFRELPNSNKQFLDKCYSNYKKRWLKAWWYKVRMPRIIKIFFAKISSATS